MKRWIFLGIAGAATSLAACASILGIQDGVLDTEAGLDGVDSGPPVCISDGGEQPDNSNNVFVASNRIGEDSATCGDEITPCATFKTALSQLHTQGGSIIYASNGNYNETVALPAGVEIQGGWTIRGDGQNRQWLRVCNPADQADATIITGTEHIAIEASDIKGEAKLSDLWVATKVPAAGESVYGIFASGSSTKLTLDNVTIATGPGGDGAPGRDGDAGAPGFGTCSPGTDTTPDAGSNGDPAGVGTAAAAGISSPPASLGLLGTTGESGTIGSDGGCDTCYKCTGVAVACDTSTTTPSCGLPGNPGCGGGGGFGGQPGQSGGSSIGIYLWGGAVVINGGVIHGGNGGSGGAGGKGGPGGGGSTGSMGAAGGTCNTACNAVLCSATSGAGPGGPGSVGAPGSSGGAGGGGAGGDSFGIVTGLDASVTVQTAADIKGGPAGKAGAPNGPAGVSKDRYP